MAVQAQNPSTALPDLRNRSVQLPNLDLSGIDPRAFLVPFPYGALCPQQSVLHAPTPAPVQCQDRLLQPVTSTAPGSTVPNLTMFHPQMPQLIQQQQQLLPQAHLDMNQNAAGQRKRRKNSSDKRSQRQSAALSAAVTSQQQIVDLNQVHGCSSVGHQSGIVSTGLRLAFDDDRSTVTSSRPEIRSSTIGDELSSQILQQEEEVNKLLRVQTDQLRHALEERTHLHSKALIATIEEEVNRRLREREMELERVTRRAVELEDKVKHLTMETHAWQSKAKSYESMVNVLRANLQQALAHQSREQSKVEGCGDSEADDAASVYIDNNAEAQHARAMMLMTRKTASSEVVRACKRCRLKEASLLLLPCLHLCLCNDCKGYVETCPVCNAQKSASVEVYLS